MFVVGGEHIKTQGKSKKLKLAISAVLLGTSMLAGSAAMAEDLNYAGITADGDFYTATDADGNKEPLKDGTIGDGTGKVTIENKDSNKKGINARNDSSIIIRATDAEISSRGYGIDARGGSDENTSVTIESTKADILGTIGGLAAYGAHIEVTANTANLTGESSVGILVQRDEVDKYGHVTKKHDTTKATINVDNLTVTGKTRTIEADYGGEIAINATGNVTVNGGNEAAIMALASDTKVDIKAETLNITSNGAFGVHVQNNTETATAPDNRATVNLTADTINITNKTKDGLGLSAFSNGLMNVNGNLTVNADHVIDVRGNSTMNINTDGKHSTVLNGDIVFETPNTPGDAQNSGKIINANVNINLTGENSAWTGKAYQEYKVDGKYITSTELQAPPYHGNVTGFNLTIADGAAWNATGDSFVNNITVNNAAINVSDTTKVINIDKMAVDNAQININGTDTQVKANTLSGNANINLASGNPALKKCL